MSHGAKPIVPTVTFFASWSRLTVSLLRRQSFLDELVEFSQSYDLHDSGYKYREEQAKKKTCMMQDEMLLLEAGTTILAGIQSRLVSACMHWYVCGYWLSWLQRWLK